MGNWELGFGKRNTSPSIIVSPMVAGIREVLTPAPAPFVILCLVTLSGCSAHKVPSTEPSSNVTSFPEVADSAFIGPASPGPVDFPVHAYPTLALLSVSGLVSVDYAPAADGTRRPGHITDYRGVPWTYGCMEGLALRTAGGSLPLPPSTGCSPADSVGTESAWASYVYVGGTTVGRWTGGIPGDDGRYSGGFSVYISPVAATAWSNASVHTIVRGDTITFGGGPVPSRLGGLPMPISLRWRYVTNTGLLIRPCGPWSPCNYAPTVSGIMYLDATVNHQAVTRAEPIEVLDSLPPPPPDAADGWP